MAKKERSQIREYPGCEEATKKARRWEKIKPLGWSIWLCLAFGTLSTATTIKHLIAGTFHVDMLWMVLIHLFLFLPGAYSYLFRSRYTYPTCEELFLASQKTEENAKETDQKIQAISRKKWRKIKGTFIVFSVIYFAFFLAVLIACCKSI